MALCKYGPILMKKRKPFDLTFILIVYNFIQVIGCTIIGLIGAYYGFIKYKYNFTCEPVDYSSSEHGMAILNLTYGYFMFKIFDLLDTVFIVLKKKESQLTFLHCYHHCGMVFMVYIASKWLPGGTGFMLGFVNTFVHSIMYFYYFITGFKTELKQSIWWKKHITQVQLIQFAILFIHFFRSAFADDCSFPKSLSFLVGLQNLFMLALFSDFYYKSYVKKRIVKEKTSRAE